MNLYNHTPFPSFHHADATNEFMTGCKYVVQYLQFENVFCIFIYVYIYLSFYFGSLYNYDTENKTQKSTSFNLE